MIDAERKSELRRYLSRCAAPFPGWRFNHARHRTSRGRARIRRAMRAPSAGAISPRATAAGMSPVSGKRRPINRLRPSARISASNAYTKPAFAGLNSQAAPRGICMCHRGFRVAGGPKIDDGYVRKLRAAGAFSDGPHTGCCRLKPLIGVNVATSIQLDAGRSSPILDVFGTRR